MIGHGLPPGPGGGSHGLPLGPDNVAAAEGEVHAGVAAGGLGNLAIVPRAKFDIVPRAIDAEPLNTVPPTTLLPKGPIDSTPFSHRNTH